MMTDEFTYNARQYRDFRNIDDDFDNDRYFEQTDEVNLYENISDTEIREMSETESESFYSPINNGSIFLRSKIRKSLSLNNLPTESFHSPKDAEVCNEFNTLRLEKFDERPRPNSAASYNFNNMKTASQDHINRLALPKQPNSKVEMTLAESIEKFQVGTPKRFRSKPQPKMDKIAMAKLTKPKSPKLKSLARTRPVIALSKEQQEEQEMEEAKKYKIRAHPVNKKILNGPLKPQIDKKPPTTIEPFHLTGAKKKTIVCDLKPVSTFKAKPVPKSLHNPFKVQTSTQPPTKGQSPKFSKRLTNTTPKKPEKSENTHHANSQEFKLTRTLPVPFSFEKRDQELLKKKEMFINKVLEEERKAREFHARPTPKSILRSKNDISNGIGKAQSLKSFKNSTEDIEIPTFKARPASVLLMKPFEPKRGEHHVVKAEGFQLSTDQRLQERHRFEEMLKEKEALAEAHKREQEENQKKLQEVQVAQMRKQMEFKAQPIKKYKEINIVSANKLTQPISPKFHTDRIRNKENIF